ncbi:MAG: chemotaxis protein CheX [Acidobacteria bacterium]|nr:chemotaxis protein CheX [Acidobacteriota bacterium]
MMGLIVESVEIPWHPVPDRIIAAVQFSGQADGALFLETDQPHARWFAGCLLGMEPPRTVDDDVRDALGELANVIGGNLKDTLAPGASLSLPSVVDGSEFSVRICNSTVAGRQAFSTDGAVFWISWIVKRSSVPAGFAGEEIGLKAEKEH